MAPPLNLSPHPFSWRSLLSPVADAKVVYDSNLYSLAKHERDAMAPQAQHAQHCCCLTAALCRPHHRHSYAHGNKSVQILSGGPPVDKISQEVVIRIWLATALPQPKVCACALHFEGFDVLNMRHVCCMVDKKYLVIILASLPCSCLLCGFTSTLLGEEGERQRDHSPAVAVCVLVQTA